jgi:two-component sensor histidine kinase
MSVRNARRIALDFISTYCNADSKLRSDVALCVSEAVTNAVIHAYPTRAGEITFSISQADNELLLEVCDEGVGTAADSPNRGLGMGTQIINTLSDATFEHVDGSGLRVTMRFPCSRHSPHHPGQGDEFRQGGRLCRRDPSP